MNHEVPKNTKKPKALSATLSLRAFVGQKKLTL